MSRILLLSSAFALAVSMPLGSFAADKKGADSPVQISERQLRDLSEAVHHARHATAGLVMECEREDDLEGGEIDFIGTDIIPIIPATAEGFGPAQYLPPRPKYIALHMSELANILPLLQNEIDRLQPPDQATVDTTKAFMGEIQNIWTDVQKQYTALQAMTQTTNYDTTAIIAAATALNKDLEQIDKMKKDIYKAYKKDPTNKKD